MWAPQETYSELLGGELSGTLPMWKKRGFCWSTVLGKDGSTSMEVWGEICKKTRQKSPFSLGNAVDGWKKSGLLTS